MSKNISIEVANLGSLVSDVTNSYLSDGLPSSFLNRVKQGVVHQASIINNVTSSRKEDEELLKKFYTALCKFQQEIHQMELDHYKDTGK